MTIDQKAITVETFAQIATLPENQSRHIELLDGEIVEVPTNRLAAWIAFRIAYLLQVYLDAVGQKRVWITTGDGGYDMDGNVFAPDVALADAPPGDKGFDKVIPLLAVEVISNPNSNEEQSILRRKVAHYIRLGVTAWVVDFAARQVEIIRPDAPTKVFGAEDTLTDERLLPGFALVLRDIFNADQEAD